MKTLVRYQKTYVNPSCIDKLDALDKKGKELGWPRFLVDSSTNQEEFNPLSPKASGREFIFTTGGSVESLWAAAIPLGFIPWNRYPVQDENSGLFHYYGNWKMLIDFLHSEGRGEWAWSSFCCAVLLEVGKWEGTKPIERGIQANLHRLGKHCGAIDGIIGERTLGAMKALGVSEMSPDKALQKLESLYYEEPKTGGEPTGGFIYLGGRKSEVFSSGNVHIISSNNGYTISIEGKGKILIELE